LRHCSETGYSSSKPILYITLIYLNDKRFYLFISITGRKWCQFILSTCYFVDILLWRKRAKQGIGVVSQRMRLVKSLNSLVWQNDIASKLGRFLNTGLSHNYSHYLFNFTFLSFFRLLKRP
jgi:hypothetical protein